MKEPHSLKITIFGLALSSSWGNGHATPYRAILKALHRRGHTVRFYEKDLPFYASRRDFTRCSYCDLILYRSWDEIRDRALGDLRDSDVVVNASYCPEGARIIDDVLNVTGPAHLFYDLDTPITLAGLRQGEVEYLRRDQIPEFALYLSFTGGSILHELESEWHARAARPLYGCVDPELYVRVAPRPAFECSLSYMGTYAADRQHNLEALFVEPARRLSDQVFVLAGALYPREWQWPANVRRFDHIAPADHTAFYSSARATLNLTRAGMARTGYCPSGRFFEAAACGTPIVSDDFDGLETFFTPGEEIMLAAGTDDVLRWLAAPAPELAAIAERARRRTLLHHTGDGRAEQLLGYIAELTNAIAASEVA